jgi:hypothetical protein
MSRHVVAKESSAATLHVASTQPDSINFTAVGGVPDQVISEEIFFIGFKN